MVITGPACGKGHLVTDALQTASASAKHKTDRQTWESTIAPSQPGLTPVQSLTLGFNPDAQLLSAILGLARKRNHDEPPETNTENGSRANLGFIHAFVASISVIIVSELGDKTFFIAAIMAMRHPRLTVFLGAIFALGLMTILSAVFGLAATIIPRAYTYYISTALFVIFGLKMLKEGYYMSPNEGQEEFEEVQSDLRKREDEYEKEAASSLIQDPESGIIRKSNKQNSIMKVVSRIFLQSFTLTFLAEWGDRSQLTTIILAAREDVVGVTIGGILGHALCTGLAVLGGRMIAQRISVRTVTLIGGVVFLLFAVTSLFLDPNAQ